ncbi:MAG TPA: TolC family protein [Epulopiscium sp.]|nr:TolC family protein [Candidatus Epulonipiscium sp.]
MKKKTIYITLLIMLFSLTTIHANESKVTPVENGLKELRVEDAIIKAQQRSKKLRMQGTNVEYAKVNKEAAKENYYNSWDIGFEQASASYSKATANETYERKNEEVIAEQVGYEIETQFDDILELEEKYQVGYANLNIQKQKLNHAIKKEELGVGSTIATKAEKTKLQVQNKDMEGLIQAIDTGYRKLNDAIGGKDERYILVKENIYAPLDMKRSLQGQVSHAINNDIGLWLQEEIAESDKTAFIAQGPDGGAPTYTLYQQRKLSYAQAINNVSLTKEGKEEQIKQIYENIQALEIQHDKIVIDLEEAQRQYNIMKKRYDLGMITLINLEELELGIIQNQAQLSSTIRTHNQLKMVFEKSYLGTAK